MEQPDRVAAVILAAGESRRFGSPKQLATLDGRPLLQHVIDAAGGAGLAPIIAVVPPGLPPLSASVSRVDNPQPELGMSYSLRLGFGELPEDADAAVILLGDQPTVDASLIHALLAARGATPFVSTRVDGVLVPPVLVEGSYFATVQEARGDSGLRDILRRDPALVTGVDLAAPLPDVDVPDDLAAMKAQA